MSLAATRGARDTHFRNGWASDGSGGPEAICREAAASPLKEATLLANNSPVDPVFVLSDCGPMLGQVKTLIEEIMAPRPDGVLAVRDSEVLGDRICRRCVAPGGFADGIGSDGQSLGREWPVSRW